MINNLFVIIERLLSIRYINIFKTIYLNFRLLPFVQAIHFPIFVTGQLKILSLRGSVTIEGDIRRGMIRLGCPISRYRNSYSQVHISGNLILKGNLQLLNGYNLSVERDACLILGKNIVMSDGVTIIASKLIEIGDYTRILKSTIRDSDVHYTVNTADLKILPHTTSVKIGNYNWITEDVKILKNTITPDNTIITSGSVTNKDYTKSVPEYSMIGGLPAKLIKTGVRRVYNFENEGLLNDYFNTGKNCYILTEDENMDSFCSYKKKQNSFWNSSV